MEKPIIILSAAAGQSNEFIADRHRLLVALTRAQHHLIVIGNADVLVCSSQAFADVLAFCQESQRYSSTGDLPLLQAASLL